MRATAAENVLTANVATVTANINNEIIRAVASERSINASITSGSGACAVATSGGTGSAKQEYWTDLTVAGNETISVTFATANLAGTVLKVLGIGFESYYKYLIIYLYTCIHNVLYLYTYTYHVFLNI